MPFGVILRHTMAFSPAVDNRTMCPRGADYRLLDSMYGAELVAVGIAYVS
jgi:hypothetical protein